MSACKQKQSEQGQLTFHQHVYPQVVNLYRTVLLTIGFSRNRVAIVIHLEVKLGVVQSQGAIGCTPRLEMPRNGVQS